MKKVSIMRNMKHLIFITLLAVTGIAFFYRDSLEEQLERIIKIGLASYEESIDLPERPQPEEKDRTESEGAEKQGTVSGGDADNAQTGMAQAGQESGNPDKAGEPAGWEYVTADESYFDDAVFIGDSRTVGLCDYAGLDNATFYASTGLTVYKIFDAQIASVEGSRQKITIEEALSEKQFSKIYLMLGINEMGTGTVESFMKRYKDVVAHLQELQPDAVIYLQAIMRVSGERSAKGDYINNEGIDARNAEIAKLADNRTIFYLDVNPLVCDEDGGLVKDYTFDGVHLKAAYIEIWKRFLMEHTVKFL